MNVAPPTTTSAINPAEPDDWGQFATLAARAAAVATWAGATLAAWALDGQADLGSQALPLVLAAALSGLWLPMPAVALACAVAVLGFNWWFVEPRGSFHVLLHRDALLLGVMLAVSLGVAALMARQRRLADEARAQAQRIAQLLALAEALRQAEGPGPMVRALAQALHALGLPCPQFWPLTLGPALPPPPAPLSPQPQATTQAAAPRAAHPSAANPSAPALAADELSGLAACMQSGQAFGPGTGRYENLFAWYLPLRAAPAPVGALLLRAPVAGGAGRPVPAAGLGAHFSPGGADALAQVLAQAQALCDLTGQALARHAAQQQAEQSRQQAQAAQWRTTWLGAISHDYRTPLAAVLGAASSLQDQGERLGAEQRRHLAGRIVDEVSRLARVTDNALQLARLDGPRPPAQPPRLAMDWQAPEELVGGVLQRLRQRWPQARLHAELPPGLPLLRCDAVLVVQALENLLDNALRHSPAGAPVTVTVRVATEPETDPTWLALQVRDTGPGLPPAVRAWLAVVGGAVAGVEGAATAQSAPPPSPSGQRPGFGLGLPLCRAIADEHGGQLLVWPVAGPGTCLGLRLPLSPLPAPLPDGHDA